MVPGTWLPSVLTADCGIVQMMLVFLAYKVQVLQGLEGIKVRSSWESSAWSWEWNQRWKGDLRNSEILECATWLRNAASHKQNQQNTELVCNRKGLGVEPPKPFGIHILLPCTLDAIYAITWLDVCLATSHSCFDPILFSSSISHLWNGAVWPESLYFGIMQLVLFFPRDSRLRKDYDFDSWKMLKLSKLWGKDYCASGCMQDSYTMLCWIMNLLLSFFWYKYILNTCVCMWNWQEVRCNG